MTASLPVPVPADTGPTDYRILPEWQAAQRDYTSDWPELSASGRLARRTKAVERMREIEAAHERGDLADEIATYEWADRLAAQLPPLTGEEVSAVAAIARTLDTRRKAQVDSARGGDSA